MHFRSSRALATALLSAFATLALAQTYNTWRSTEFTSTELADSTISGPGADPDGDGLSNLQEYVFVGAPKLTDTGIAPTLELLADTLALTYRERHGLATSGVRVNLEVSDFLTHWITPNTVVEADREAFAAEGFDLVTLLDPLPYRTSGQRRFLRLRVDASALSTALKAPTLPVLSALSPTTYELRWNDWNFTETGHQIERLSPTTSLWESVGTTFADTAVWQHTSADYRDGFTYRVAALRSTDGASVASASVSLLDEDGDGIPNVFELGANYFGGAGTYSTFPDSFSSGDTGISDSWMIEHDFDPFTHDVFSDTDDDGLSDYEEAQRGTDPRLVDTDGDGVLDDADGWPRHSWIKAPARASVYYAVIPLDSIVPGLDGYAARRVSETGEVLLSSPGPVSTYELLRLSAANKAPVWQAYGQNPLPEIGVQEFLQSFHAFTSIVDYFSPGNALSPFSWFNPDFMSDEGAIAMPRWNPATGLLQGAIRSPDGALRWIGHASGLPTPPELPSVFRVSAALASRQTGEVALMDVAFCMKTNPYVSEVVYLPSLLRADGTRQPIGEPVTHFLSTNGQPFSDRTLLPRFLNSEGVVAGPVLPWNGAYGSHGGFWTETGGIQSLPLNKNESSSAIIALTDGSSLAPSMMIVTYVVAGQFFHGVLWETETGVWQTEELQFWDPDRQQTINLRPISVNETPEFIAHGTQSYLVSGGVARPLNELMANPQWDIPAAYHINNHGIIAAVAKETLDAAGLPIPPAQQVSEPVLLVPVELTISHPEVTAPEPPEYVVNADTPSVLLTAHVTGAADGTLVGWEIVTGTGTLSHAETATVDGFAQTTLTTSTTVGDVYRVTARVKRLILPALESGGTSPEFDFEALGLAATDSSLHQTTADITVVAGFAAAIAVTRETSAGQTATTLPADGQSRLVLVADVRDAFGQPVAENTPVTWHLSGGGRLESADAITDVDGFARATLVAGQAVAAQKVRIEADGFEIVETVANTAVAGSLVAAASTLDLATGQTTTLTANLPDVADGTPLRWFTSLGEIENPAFAVQNGQATATLRATGGRVGPAVVTVSAGGALHGVEVAFISSAPIAVSVDHPVIAGDVSTDGTHSVPRLDGTTQNVAYRAGTPVRISAPAYAGHTATVRLGKHAAATSLRYSFDQIIGGVTPSANGEHPATVSGATLDSAIRHEGAASLLFDGDDDVLGIADAPALRLQPGLAISLWVNAADAGGSLVAKTGEYDLFIDSQGRIVFSITSATGPHTVTGPPLPLEQWTLVRAEYGADGTLRLGVGGHTVTVPTAGEAATGTALVVVGDDFGGWLDLLTIEAGDAFDAGTGLTIDGLDANGQVILDANGEATLAVSGNDSGWVGEAIPVRHVGIRVSINPTADAEKSFIVTTRQNYAILDAALGDLRLAINGAPAPIPAAQREQLLARCLREMESTGQRAAAVPFTPTGTLAERQQYAFRVLFWMESIGDGPARCKVIFQNTEALALMPEEKQVFEELLTGFFIDAIQAGSDEAANARLLENHGGLLTTLAQLSAQGNFGALAAAINNYELFEALGYLHESHGPGVLGELAGLAQMERVRNPTFVQRLVASLRDFVAASANQWTEQIHASMDVWMRERTMQAFAEGKFTAEEAFYVGYGWGLFSEAYTAAQGTAQSGNILATLRMAEQMAMTVIAAHNGNEEAKAALQAIVPAWGLTVMNDSTNQLVEQGQYFDAGVGSAQLSVNAVGTATGIVGMAKLSVTTAKAGRIGVAVKKGGPERLPASFGKADIKYRRADGTWDHRKAFQDHWGLTDEEMSGIQVHHAVERQALRVHGYAAVDEFKIESPQNLRGIPKQLTDSSSGKLIHQSTLARKWNAFYRHYREVRNRQPNEQELLRYAELLDDRYGHLFYPAVR